MNNKALFFVKNTQVVKIVIAKKVLWLKRYYENKVKVSNQQKIYYEKIKDKLLQKQIDRYIQFKYLVRPSVELDNTLKALEEKTDNKSS